jgi:hypothetical protein
MPNTDSCPSLEKADVDQEERRPCCRRATQQFSFALQGRNIASSPQCTFLSGNALPHSFRRSEEFMCNGIPPRESMQSPDFRRLHISWDRNERQHPKTFRKCEPDATGAYLSSTNRPSFVIRNCRIAMVLSPPVTGTIIALNVYLHPRITPFRLSSP